MGNGSGVSRGDRGRSARRGRLRVLVPVTDAVAGTGPGGQQADGRGGRSRLEGHRAADVPVPGPGSWLGAGLGRGPRRGGGVGGGEGVVRAGRPPVALWHADRGVAGDRWPRRRGLRPHPASGGGPVRAGGAARDHRRGRQRPGLRIGRGLLTAPRRPGRGDRAPARRAGAGAAAGRRRGARPGPARRHGAADDGGPGRARADRAGHLDHRPARHRRGGDLGRGRRPGAVRRRPRGAQAARPGPAGEAARRAHRPGPADRAGTTRAAAGSPARGAGSPAR